MKSYQKPAHKIFEFIFGTGSYTREIGWRRLGQYKTTEKQSVILKARLFLTGTCIQFIRSNEYSLPETCLRMRNLELVM
jgi:hypothetical protein